MPTEARVQTPERGPQRGPPDFRFDGRLLQSGDAVGAHCVLERPVSPGCRVWLATHDAVGRVALKPGPRARIRREYELLAAISHPSIVRAIELVDGGDDAVLVLEYLSGGDLVSLSGEEPAYWIEAIADITRALRYLHARDLVHRDLKARNVMFDDAGRARLIDFGSAAVVGADWTPGGTTAIAVDPARGSAPVRPADDIHALAVLLYELIHGAPPDAPAGLESLHGRETTGTGNEPE